MHLACKCVPTLRASLHQTAVNFCVPASQDVCGAQFLRCAGQPAGQTSSVSRGEPTGCWVIFRSGESLSPGERVKVKGRLCKYTVLTISRRRERERETGKGRMTRVRE